MLGNTDIGAFFSGGGGDVGDNTHTHTAQRTLSIVFCRAVSAPTPVRQTWGRFIKNKYLSRLERCRSTTTQPRQTQNQFTNIAHACSPVCVCAHLFVYMILGRPSEQKCIYIFYLYGQSFPK